MITDQDAIQMRIVLEAIRDLAAVSFYVIAQTDLVLTDGFALIRFLFIARHPVEYQGSEHLRPQRGAPRKVLHFGCR